MRCHWGPRDVDVCEDMMLEFLYDENDEEDEGYKRKADNYHDLMADFLHLFPLQM